MKHLPRRLALAALALLGLAAACTPDAQPDPAREAWVENVGLERFGARQTLYGLGKPVGELYGLDKVVTSRDPSLLSGPEAAPRLLLLSRPAGLPHHLMVFDGQEKRLDVPLSLRDKLMRSPTGSAIALFDGLSPPLGPEWTPGADIRVYRLGATEPVIIPREQGIEPGVLLDDGTVIIRDSATDFRRYAPDGTLAARLSLPDVHLATAEPGAPRSQLIWLGAQERLAVADFAGPADGKGRRIQSGLRVFDLRDGRLVASFPAGVTALGGAADPHRYLVLEKPGVLVQVTDDVRGRSGPLPGTGEMTISPDGGWVAITGDQTHLWLYDTAIMNGVWDHTSPEPWNRLIPGGTQVKNGGRVFGARRHEAPDGRLLQMQLFTLDADGSGKVLLERPYQDAGLPPVWIIGATDAGRQAMFGALGEELRVVEIP